MRLSACSKGTQRHERKLLKGELPRWCVAVRLRVFYTAAANKRMKELKVTIII